MLSDQDGVSRPPAARAAGYWSTAWSHKDGADYGASSGDVQVVGDRAELSEGGGEGIAYYFLPINDDWVKEDTFEIGVRFADWGAWFVCGGPDFFIYDWVSNEWDTICTACGDSDDYHTEWYPISNPNRYVDDSCEVWIKILSVGVCFTSVEWVEVEYNGAKEGINEGASGWGLRDDCHGDELPDGVNVVVDVDSGYEGDGAVVDLDVYGELSDPCGNVVDTAWLTWSIYDWADDPFTMTLSACEEMDGYYEFDVWVWDKCGGYSEWSGGAENIALLPGGPGYVPADVSIQSSLVDPPSEVCGGTMVYLEETVHNDSSQITTDDPFELTWFVSTNSDMDQYADFVWGGITVPACLGPGETLTGSGPLPWPDQHPYNIPETTYWVAVMADPWDTLSETDETDNWGTVFSVTLAECGLPRPDLWVPQATLTCPDGSPPCYDVQPNDEFDLWVKFENQGEATTTYYFWVRWYISYNASMDTADHSWIGGWVDFYLDPDEWGTMTVESLPWPDVAPYNEEYHTYYVAAKVDATDLVTEENESNNWGPVFEITLGPEPEQRPDLLIESSGCTPTEEVQQGDWITLTDTVLNDGDAETGSGFYATWFISTNSSMDPSDDYEWAWVYVPCCLSPGESETDGLYVQWPVDPMYTQPGATYYVAVMADDTEVITESNESNNWGVVFEVTIKGNDPPIADANGPYEGLTGQEICIDASDSYDPDGYITGYRWDWTNNGSWDTEWQGSPYGCHEYDTFTGLVRVQVKDNQEATDEATASVTVTPGTAYLHGTVRDAGTGAAIQSATVSLSGEGSETTNAQGYYDFGAVEAGTKTLTVQKTGYYTWQDSITLPAGDSVNQDVDLIEVVDLDDPEVLLVDGVFCSPFGQKTYYLHGIYAWDALPLVDNFTATVHWGDHPAGRIRWETGYNTYEDECTDIPTCTKLRQFDMSGGFPEGGELKVTAIAGDDAQSPVKTANLRVIPPPPGIMMALLYATPTGDQLSYTAPSLTTDPNKLDQGADGVPQDMPLFGGEAFKLIAAFDFEASVNSHGEASGLKIDPDIPPEEKKTKIAGFEWAPVFNASTSWTYHESQGWVPGGEFNFGIEIGADVPPRPVPFMFGPIPCYFRGHIDIGVAFQLVVVGWAEPGDPILDGYLVLDPFPYAEVAVGAGVADIAAIEGYLGGGARMTLNYPPVPPEPVLEQLQVFLTGGVRIVVWIFTYEWPALNYTWDLYSGRYVADPGRRIMRIMPRDYLKRDGGYAVFIGDRPRRGGRSILTQEAGIEGNVFDQSTATLAAVGDDLLVVWIHDEEGRSAIDRTEVVFRQGLWDTQEQWWVWGDRTAIADDETADYHPQIAALPNGDALLTWENVSEVLIEPGEPGDPCIEFCTDPGSEDCLECKLEELKSKTEIAVTKYDSATGTWESSAIPAENNITDNTYLDRSPRIVAAADGTAMLTWVSNATNHQTGDPENPNDVHFVMYDGSDWSTPADVTLGVPSIIRSDMAYDGTQAVLVFIGDTDGDVLTLEDRELFAIEYDGSTWGSIMQLTTDGVEDANPQAVYDSYGGLLLVSYRAGDLVMTTDLDAPEFDPVVELESAASSGVADFSLATGFAGQIALVWQEATDEQAVDMWRAIYDPALQLWSNAQRLTNDNSMEHAMSPVYDASGNLVAVYDKVQVQHETRTVYVNGEPVEVDVPVPVQTDLYVLRHTVTGDLAIRAEDIVVTPPDPSVGEVVTITAKVRNLGDVAGIDVDVAFYDGNPSQGGLLIDMPVIEGLLIGGDEAEACVQWLVPESPEQHDIYVRVDPNETQEDGDWTNNTAMLQGGFKPDLFIDSILVQEAGPDALILTVRVANDSGWEVSDVEVTLRRDAVDGDLLTTLTLTDPIAPGTHHDASWVWHDYGACGGTVSVYAIVDESDAVDEFDETNNTRMALAQLSESFTPFDLNYDGFPSIAGDVPPFVDCVYFNDCYCPDPGCMCPGDCNGDDFLSIAGDVPCFVDCVFYGNCDEGRGDDKGAGDGNRSTETLTIGGAVYTDLDSPMMTGLERVTIEAIRVPALTAKGPPTVVDPEDLAAELAQTPDDHVERFTATTGSMGIWWIDDLPAGPYLVRAVMPGYTFQHVQAGTPSGRDYARIIVNEDNQGPNGSIQFIASE